MNAGGGLNDGFVGRVIEGEQGIGKWAGCVNDPLQGCLAGRIGVDVRGGIPLP